MRLDTGSYTSIIQDVIITASDDKKILGKITLYRREIEAIALSSNEKYIPIGGFLLASSLNCKR